ncbi:MAG: hypothetical protein L3J66_12270 [Bacteroidales bacterium]|nr:hypothetical protein [Bacteroidales bacterium]
MKRIILVVLLSAFLVSGCGLTYKVLLGVDTTPKWNTDKQILKQAEKYKIPVEYNLVLDTANYTEGLREIYKRAFENLNIADHDSSDYYNLKKALNDDQQPSQFRFYDNKGTETFKLVNCYIDPPIPLNWNVDNCFDSFPPKTSIETLNIHKFNLDFLLTNSKFINQDKLSFNEFPKADYYGVIIWNEFFKRPSKRLINTVRKYIGKTDKTVVLIFINNHNQFLWSAMGSENKEKVRTLSTIK